MRTPARWVAEVPLTGVGLYQESGQMRTPGRREGEVLLTRFGLKKNRFEGSRSVCEKGILFTGKGCIPDFL